MERDWYPPFWPVPEDLLHQRALRFADNMKKCSCWMCRNRRELEGPPIREWRHLQCDEVRAWEDLSDPAE